MAVQLLAVVALRLVNACWEELTPHLPPAHGMSDHHTPLQSTVEQVKAQACRLAGVAPDQAELTLGARHVARSEQHATVASLGLVLEPPDFCILALKVDRLPEHLPASKPVRSPNTGSDQTPGSSPILSASRLLPADECRCPWVEARENACGVGEGAMVNYLPFPLACAVSSLGQASYPGGLQQRYNLLLG